MKYFAGSMARNNDELQKQNDEVKWLQPPS